MKMNSFGSSAVASALAGIAGAGVLAVSIPASHAHSLGEARAAILDSGVYFGFFALFPVFLVVSVAAALLAASRVDLLSPFGRRLGLALGSVIGAVAVSVVMGDGGAEIDSRSALAGLVAGAATSFVFQVTYRSLLRGAAADPG